MAEEKNYKNKIDEINSQTTSILYGVSQDFIDKNNIEINKIKDTIKRISTRNNYITGDNPVEFLTKMAYNDKNNNIKSALSKIPKDDKGKTDLNKFLNGMTLSQVNEIYAQELDRISGYDDYRAITRYIPQIAQGINIWKDNIISPDDFTKDIFDIIYDDESDEKLKNKVEDNIRDVINKNYKIENKVSEWIKNTLITGDEFIAILKLEDEFNKMLNSDILKEDGKFEILDESIQLTESNTIIDDSERTLLENYYIEEMTKKDKNFNEKDLDKNKVISEMKKEISEVLNHNIKYTTNSINILENEIPAIKSMMKEIDKSNKYAGDNEKLAKEFNLTSDGTKIKDKRIDFRKLNGENYINGSYIKTLEPDRVIKIKIGEIVYGYFYIEVKGKNELIHPKNVYSALTLRQTVDLTSSDTSMIDDPKVRLITDLFAKNISKKIDKEFVANNKEFKTIIYELIKSDYLYNNNIQITYFDPNTVKHLMVEEDKDGYGISVLKDIVFTAKLYLSVLITTLLTKISRSQEHRTFYVETGLSEDVEGIVNAFIRDTKTKDVKISDTQSIDSIFNTIGSCSNFYIPTVNGEKAIEIDTTPGLNVDMDNDLLDFLRKTMLSGMGIPSSMLNYADEIEFARSLSMQNGMFLRSVITKQKKLTDPFTSLYQALYENEYGNSVISLFDRNEISFKNKNELETIQKVTDNKRIPKTNKKDNKYDNNEIVDIQSIKVKFPSPAALNSTNISEQISTGSSIVQAIAEAMFDSNDQNLDQNHKFRFIKELNKLYIPNVDWDKIEELYDKTEQDSVEYSFTSQIKNSKDESNTDSY